MCLIGIPVYRGSRGGRVGRGSGRNGRGGRHGVSSHNAFAAKMGSPRTGGESDIHDVDCSLAPTLTEDQWKQFMTILKGAQSSSSSCHGTYYSNDWIIDTGASNHMTVNINFFSDLRDILHSAAGLPNGNRATATKEGTVKLSNQLVFHNVLYVPSLTCNLLSVSQLLEEHNYLVLFTHKFCIIQALNLKNLIGAGVQCNGVYLLRHVPRRSLQANKVGVSEASLLWHRRLGHPSMKVVSSLPGMGSSNKNCDVLDCHICFMGKQPRNSFSLSMNKASDLFDLVHCDIWGPEKVLSSCNASYFLTIVDDYSRATWVYLMTGKYEVGHLIKKFYALVKTQFNKKIKVLRSDNGQEFICLKSFFDKTGILHQTSCVDTAQQNGRVERKHKHILNVARALRFQAKLPKYFW